MLVVVLVLEVLVVSDAEDDEFNIRSDFRVGSNQKLELRRADPCGLVEVFAARPCCLPSLDGAPCSWHFGG